MKKAFKFTAIALATILILGMVAVFVLWHYIDAKTVQYILNKKLATIKSINISISNIKVYKKFSDITIVAGKIKAENNDFSATFDNAKDTLPLFYILMSKISGRKYVGLVEIDRASFYIKKNTSNKSAPNLNLSNLNIPTLPIDLKISHLNLNYQNIIKASGRLKEEFNPIISSNNISYTGEINGFQTKILLKAKRNTLNTSILTPYVNFNDFEAKKFYLELSLFKGKSHIYLASKELENPYINLKNINLDATFEIGNPIKISNLSLKTNTLLLNMSGLVNLNNPKESNIEGDIKLTQLRFSDIKKLPKVIKSYVKQGEISINDLKFSGKPDNFNFIKRGKLKADNIAFRIDPKSGYFSINRANVNILQDKIIAIGSGYFDNITTKKSVFIVYRKRGFPCDMHLNLKGYLSKRVKIFLEENIFSENDLKILGKTENMNGYISSKIDIYNYFFKPKPLFNFSISLYTKNISFANKNIPNGFVQATGNILIKRTVRNSRIRSFFIKFSNFKANTRTSLLKTKTFKLTIKPYLGFYGDFNLSLSKKDSYYFKDKFFKAKNTLNIGRIESLGSMSGTLKNFNFSTKANVIFDNKTLELETNGNLTSPILKIYTLKLYGVGELALSGALNLKNKKFISISAKAKNLKIKSLRKFLNLPKNIGGTITGELNANYSKSNVKINSGYLSIKDGWYEILKNINGKVIFRNTIAKTNSLSLNILNNKVNLIGSINLSNFSGNIEAYSDRFIIDLNKLIKIKSKQTKLSITIPNNLLAFTFKANEFILKNKNKQTSGGSVKIKLLNSKRETKLLMESRKIYLNTLYNKIRNKIDVNLKDMFIWPTITICDKKNNILTIYAKLLTGGKPTIYIDNLKGKIKLSAKNGCFNTAPSAINIISVLNPFKSILNGMKISKIEYSKLSSDMYLNRGIITVKDSDPVMLKGNINIFGYGHYNIDENYINMYVTFITFSAINKIISHIPIIGWIIGGKEKSFMGLSFHVRGQPKNLSVKPIPFKNLTKGALGVIKRTLMLPLSIFGVK